MNSGHAGPSTGGVASQTSTSAPASFSDQESSTSAPSSDQGITALSQPLPPTAEQQDVAAMNAPSATVTEAQVESNPTQAPRSLATGINTSAPLIWTEASTPSQPPHNTIASSSSTSESSSRALQPLSPNTRNSVPQRRAFVEDDDEGDENEARTPKRQRGDGDVESEVGESSSGVNMLT